MKKAFYLLINLLLFSQLTTAQSVTLATSIPVSPTKGTVVYNNGTNQLQYWNGTAWIPITNAASGTGWALNGANINNNNAGNVGIGTDAPATKLTIQTPNNTDGFSHISDGGIVLKETVGGVSATLGTFSNHTLRLMTNSLAAVNILPNGYVGIGTTNPLYPLEVNGSDYSSTNMPIRYFDVNFPLTTCGSCVSNASISASNAVRALRFDAYSDARIKNIISISNSAEDLETIKALQITDYTMTDKVQHGNKSFKKVIAQQVEKIYPQAVSLSISVVPDIYSLAEKVVFDEINKTLKCSLPRSYDIKIGEKIEFIHEKEGKIKAIVEEVSGNSFTVKDWKYATDKIFVYGREVNNFRSVDYEAISMLGISAIQQLAKENEELKSKFTTENDVLKKQIADLNARFENLEAMITKEAKITEKLNN